MMKYVTYFNPAKYAKPCSLICIRSISVIDSNVSFTLLHRAIEPKFSLKNFLKVFLFKTYYHQYDRIFLNEFSSNLTSPL